MIFGKSAIHYARVYALEKHGNQMYGDKPYSYHLDMVYHTLCTHQVTDADILVASYLHDLLEDTNVSKKEIELLFGLRVSNLVYALTGFGKTRAERNKNSSDKILLFGDDAVTLKLADRISNIENCKANNKKLLSMYLKENDAFSNKLKGLGNVMLWKTLNSLVGA